MFRERRSGILLHITSLPSRFGMGDLGPAAYGFADWLHSADQGLWQTLPLSPVTSVAHFSPYSSPSAFAGNPLLISPEVLCDEGLLDRSELPEEARAGAGREASKVDFVRSSRLRVRLLRKACGRLLERVPQDFEIFCRVNGFWLDDYAFFMALKAHHAGGLWAEWPRPVRDREPGALGSLREELAEEILRVCAEQYFFHRQWEGLKAYCHGLGIQLVGDMPIYVAYDSADVWSHPELFQLDGRKRLTAVSGIPPTDDIPNGQMWGMPLYDWDRLEATGFKWWIQRIGENLKLYDWLRIDHFLGLANYWRIPADLMDARKGRWIAGPREKLFRALYSHFASIPLIAEDVGFVTLEARQIMQRYQLPGLSILLIAFMGPPGNSEFAPHNHQVNSLVCTGTHDFNTVRGWFDGAGRQERQRFFDYVGRRVSAADASWEMVRLVHESVSRMAIIPMQDILGLGPESRMNRPGTSRGNWVWRLLPGQADGATARRLKKLTELSGRGG